MLKSITIEILVCRKSYLFTTTIIKANKTKITQIKFLMIIFKQFYPRCHPIYCCTPANI